MLPVLSGCCDAAWKDNSLKNNRALILQYLSSRSPIAVPLFLIAFSLAGCNSGGTLLGCNDGEGLGCGLVGEHAAIGSPSMEDSSSSVQQAEATDAAAQKVSPEGDVAGLPEETSDLAGSQNKAAAQRADDQSAVELVPVTEKVTASIQLASEESAKVAEPVKTVEPAKVAEPAKTATAEGDDQSPAPSKASEPIQTIQQLQTKFSSSTVNIVNVGAVGDGKTDNYDTIINAMAGAKAVYIPQGRYYVRKPMIIPPNVDLIFGEGTLLSDSHAGIIWQSRSIDGLEIRGLTFEYKPLKDTIFGAIYFDGGEFKNIVIRDCHFVGGNKLSNGILIVGKDENLVDGFELVNNSFEDIERAAIEVLHRTKRLHARTVKNLQVKNNVFTYSRGKKGGFHVAISLSQEVYQSVLEGNRIDGYSWGIELAGSVEALVTGNTILNTKDGINSSDESIDSVIENNKIVGSFGVQFLGDKNVIFRNNEVHGTVYFLESDGFLLENNTIDSDYVATVIVRGTTNGVMRNNKISGSKEADGRYVRIDSNSSVSVQ